MKTDYACKAWLRRQRMPRITWFDWLALALIVLALVSTDG